MKQGSSFLTRAVWLVSLVSLFTDMAGEMLYPVMPLFLQHMGFSGVWAGVMESIADALAGISKPYFGRLSDQRQQRKPFIQWGYTLSAVAKPAMALFSFLPAIVLFRSADRLGKGMRSGARDALLTEVSLPEHRGRVFGFHRAMDTAGAIAGPLLALLYLHYFPNGVRSLFLWAFVPGILAVGITFFLREAPQVITKTSPEKLSWIAFWRASPTSYRQAIGLLGAIACVNASDMFLLMRAASMQAAMENTVYLYLLYNGVYALLAYPLGSLSDKWGMKPVLLGGFLVLALVYGAMAGQRTTAELIVLFCIYGVYAAATEGLGKAWISQCCLPEYKAQSLGLLSGIQSIGILISGGLYAGLSWMGKETWAFYLTACVVSLVVLIGVCLPRVTSQKM